MKRKRKKRGELTNKQLGLADDVKLSASYANDRRHFKTVSEYVIGFYVVGDGVSAHVRIAPIYRADVWIRDGKNNAVISSHEIGAFYNPHKLPSGLPDFDGDALAALAGTALGALQRHAARQQPPKKTRKR